MFKLIGLIFVFFGLVFLIGGWWNKKNSFAAELFFGVVLLYLGLKILG